MADFTGAEALNWNKGNKNGVFQCRDGYVYTAPVGSFRPNAFGLHDMLGNVWQWTEDCFQASYIGAPTDSSAVTSGECKRRVLRGGSWSSLPGNLRSAYRLRITAVDRGGSFGFRVGRTLTP